MLLGPDGGPALSAYYARLVKGRRVLLADDVRNTGRTFARCAALVERAGGTVVATVAIVDRLAADVTLPVPNVALVEYQGPPNYPAASCPLCAGGMPITEF